MAFSLAPRYQFLLITVSLVFIALLTLPRAALADTVVGDGTPESCTTAAFTAAMAGDGLITFNCGTNPVTITLPGAYTANPGTTIDGGNLITLYKEIPGDHFRVNAGGTFTITNLIIRGNLTTDAGGIGVLGGGVFASNHVTITQNGAEVGGFGGGVHMQGIATLTDTVFIQNRARVGGGMYNSGIAILSNVNFLENVATDLSATQFSRGGAIDNSGQLSYIGGNVLNNDVDLITGTTKGGGISNSGIVTIENLIFGGNDASVGSAIYADRGETLANNLDVLLNGRGTESASAIEIRPDSGQNATFRLRRSDVLGNQGVGVWIATTTVAYIEDSAFVANTSRGILLEQVANVGISNTTVTSNTGSILLFGATLYMQDSTITNNGQSNVDLGATAALTLTNSIISGGTDTNCLVETGSAIHSGGFNISSDSTCSLSQSTDISNTNPLLLDVSDYGGPTYSQLPDANSPVIDKGRCDPGTPNDQRGIPRPQGATCDIGAVERAPSDDATPTPTPTETTTPTATGTLTATPTGTLTATPTGTPPTFDEHLFLPLVQR